MGCLNGKPPDRGYSWVVLTSSTLLGAIMTMQIGSIGVFLVEFDSYFNISKNSLTMVATCHGVIGNMCGFPIGLLVKRFGPRMMTIIASILASLGYFLPFLFPQLPVIYLAYGIITSVAFSTLYLTAIVAVQQYFKARRSLASGVVMTGGSFGVLIWGPLMEFLIDLFSWQGAMLIISGVILNALVCGLLQRPIDEYSVHKATRGLKTFVEQNDYDKNVPTSVASDRMICTDHHAEQKEHLKDLTRRNRRNEAVEIWIPYAMFLIGGAFLMQTNHVAAHTYLPMLAKEIGLTRVQGASLVSVIGLTGAVLRPIFGWIGDQPCVNRTLLYGGAVVVAGCLSIIVQFMHSYALLILYTGLFGIAIAMYSSMGPAVVVDILGLDYVAVGAGLQIFSYGLGNLALHLTAGLLMTATDSTSTVFTTCGVAGALGGWIVMFIAIFKKKRESPISMTIRN